MINKKFRQIILIIKNILNKYCKFKNKKIFFLIIFEIKILNVYFKLQINNNLVFQWLKSKLVCNIF